MSEPIKFMTGKLYIYDQQKNPFEKLEMLNESEEFELTRANILGGGAGNSEVLIFELQQNGNVGSCRGFLYPDKKYLGTITWVDNTSPTKLNGQFERGTKGIQIKGDLTRFGSVNLKFILGIWFSK